MVVTIYKEYQGFAQVLDKEAYNDFILSLDIPRSTTIAVCEDGTKVIGFGFELN